MRIIRPPKVVSGRLGALKANDQGAYAAACAVFASGDLGDRLHEIRHPTLIITGEHDIGSNTRMARFMHEAIRGSVLHILPKLKHRVLLEAPTEIAGLLLNLLSV